MVGEVPAVLDRPHDFRGELVRPAQRIEMALFLRWDFPLAEELPSVRVDGREGMGALVDIRSNHNHPARPFNRLVSFDWTSGGQAFLGAVATLLLGHAKDPGWWRTTQRTFGQARATTDRQTTSQPVTSPGPNPADRTTPTARTFLPSTARSTDPSDRNQHPVSTSWQEGQTTAVPWRISCLRCGRRDACCSSSAIVCSTVASALAPVRKALARSVGDASVRMTPPWWGIHDSASTTSTTPAYLPIVPPSLSRTASRPRMTPPIGGVSGASTQRHRRNGSRPPSNRRS